MIPPRKNTATNTFAFFSNKDKADLLNEYILQQTQVDNSEKPVPDLGPPLFANMLFDIFLTSYEIKEDLKTFQTDKASGPKGISNKVLREASRELFIPLCNLFNNSVQTSKICSSWKAANISIKLKKYSYSK